jgi:hypothetical protein
MMDLRKSQDLLGKSTCQLDNGVPKATIHDVNGRAAYSRGKMRVVIDKGLQP